MNFPKGLKGDNLQAALSKFGMTDMKKAWRAIKRVMGSKFNERVYISTKKVGLDISKIRMAVLVQRVIPAEYAFVIHTKNPLTNNNGEIYAEIVKGLGETLVGAYKGQAMSVVIDKSKLEGTVKSFMSKSVELKSEGFMFRSDSNTEDLENFAGAGLFDSFPSEEVVAEEAKYAADRLTNDEGFQKEFIKAVGRIAVAVENVYGSAQDIEGCFYKGEYYVVQTRP